MLLIGVSKVWFMHLEKFLIARADPNVLLNKRDELATKSRHISIEMKLLWSASNKDKKFYTFWTCKYTCFSFLDIVKNHLIIGDMKNSIMAICCCYLPPVYIPYIYIYIYTYIYIYIDVIQIYVRKMIRFMITGEKCSILTFSIVFCLNNFLRLLQIKWNLQTASPFCRVTE